MTVAASASVRLDAFWSTQRWHAYETAYGDAPGTRARLLASATWRTRVVDLRPEPVVLWRGVRRSYHALINRARRRTSRATVTAPCRSDAWIREFQEMHAVAAGRVTRPQGTWDEMASWLADGHALLACATEPSTWRRLAFAYFAVDGRWAYYFSAAAVEHDVNHALVYDAMLALRAAGVTHLELGWQGAATDEKGLNIEMFRRGFGGVDLAFDTELT